MGCMIAMILLVTLLVKFLPALFLNICTISPFFYMVITRTCLIVANRLLMTYIQV